MKLFLKRVICLLLVILCFGASFFSVPVLNVNATQLVSSGIVDWFLSTVGTVVVGDGVRSVSNDVKSSLSDKIQEMISGGSIYINSNGDYVFNNASTSELYNILNGDSSVDARVVSNFTSLDSIFSSLDSSYFNDEFLQACSALKDSFYRDYKSYLVRVYQSIETSGNVYTNFYIYDFSDVDYMNIISQNSGSFACVFYNGSSQKQIPSKRVLCTYRGECTISQSNSYTSELFVSFSYPFSESYSNTINNIYYDFPDLEYKNRYVTSGIYSDSYNYFFCNRSIVLSKDVSSGNTLSSRDSGIIYNNYYDVLPTFTSEDQNYNWSEIYNNYVDNVYNDYQTIYVDSGSVSARDIRNILDDNNDRLAEIIENSTQEITEDIENANQWLQMIYEKLGVLENHFSTVEGNQTDNLAALERIETSVNSMASDLHYLQQIYAYLSILLSAIENNGGGGGGINPDIVTTLPSMPDVDIDDLIDNGDIIASALYSVVPFCFIPFVGVLVNGLAVTPSSAPVFTLPIKLQNGIVNIDVEQDINLNIFDSIHDIYVGCWCLLLIFYLIFLTFKLFNVVNGFI